MHLTLPGRRTLPLDRPRIVGVLNVTPDSFSDGGRYTDPDAAVAHARQMLADGADIIDIGGESTRPGAQRIDAAEQTRRVLPVIEALAEIEKIILSVDTTRVSVAERAIDAGAHIINDVSAGRDDPDMIRFVAERGLPFVVMHMQGEPATMQHDPTYADVVAEVRDFLLKRADDLLDAGLPKSQIILDPGIGFGKTTTHNLTLIAHLHTLIDTGHPVMLAASRKRFIGEICRITDATDRVHGTVATTAAGALAGAHLFRVHDIAPNRHAADLAHAIRTHRSAGP